MTDDSPFDPFDEEVRQNLEHLAMLRRGPEVWSKWRAKNQHVKIVLKGANLSNADLRHVDLTYANLEGADLSQADLTGANLTEAVLTGVRFSGTNLTEAYFIRADLSGAKLAESLHLSQEKIEVANGNWRTSLPPGLTYPDHWEKQPQKDSPDPEHLVILLQGVDAWNAWRKENPDILPNLTGVNLIGAYLSRYNFRHANLRGADIRSASLRRSILENAVLTRANLQGATFTGARFTRADLEGANLRDADLSETFALKQEQIEAAYGDWHTLLPLDLTHPHHWDKEPDSATEHVADPAPASGAKPSLSYFRSPFPMAWNAEGKITAVAPQERPPAQGLGTGARDLLAQAQTITAQKLAFSLDNSNADRRFAEWLRDYADQSAKGGAGLSIIVLDNIVQNLRGLAVLDKEAFASSVGNAVQFSNFTANHDALTSFYPDYEDYQRAYSLARDKIPTELPDSDLVELLSTKDSSEIIDSSVTETIKAIQPSSDLLSPSDTENRKRWNLAKLGLIIRLKQLFDTAPDFVKKLEAFITIARWLNKWFEWAEPIITVLRKIGW